MDHHENETNVLQEATNIVDNVQYLTQAITL